MQKDTDDDGTTSDGGGRIGDTHDLARSALLLDLRYERESVFALETTATSLQLKSRRLVRRPDRGDASFLHGR